MSRKLAGVGASAYGVPAFAGFMPQFAIGVGLVLGTSGVRHGYRVLSTHQERCRKHEKAVDKWQKSLPKPRHEVAKTEDDIEKFRLDFRQAKFGAGSTIVVEGELGERMADTFRAACDVMKEYDKFGDAKKIATILNDFRKIAALAAAANGNISDILIQAADLGKKIGKFRKEQRDQFWENRKYESRFLAGHMLEFVANGAYVVRNENNNAMICYGLSDRVEY
ncbi:hypothetical protein [Methylobacterium sp. SyP6R]|uniref:hypothetical protein n=1 Tax=Methylobacterium sp. SyP6R TaxID=2718876 RepID=UPI001F2CF1A6|nr:hypothetical protein [Methylobacterium sp. SyP6R]MCF4130050.1 hypothetical protein [Methylobacterium sp. SyP6R]